MEAWKQEAAARGPSSSGTENLGKAKAARPEAVAAGREKGSVAPSRMVVGGVRRLILDCAIQRCPRRFSLLATGIRGELPEQFGVRSGAREEDSCA